MTKAPRLTKEMRAVLTAAFDENDFVMKADKKVYQRGGGKPLCSGHAMLALCEASLARPTKAVRGEMSFKVTSNGFLAVTPKKVDRRLLK